MSDFLVKIEGVGSLFRGMSMEGCGKNCFPLVMYGVCHNNAVCSVSLSFVMFTFFLTPLIPQVVIIPNQISNCCYKKNNIIF